MQQSIGVPSVVSVHRAINVAVPLAPDANSGVSSGSFPRINLGGVILDEGGPGKVSNVGSGARHSKATSFSGIASLRQMGGESDLRPPQPKAQV
jgi:hypothetical protein